LVKETSGDVLAAEESARTIRTLLSNIINTPFDTKFHKLNLANKIMAEKIAKYPACSMILKAAGFSKDKAGDSNVSTMTIGKGKKVINVAPLTVTRDAIDKWIEATRYEVNKAARKRKDELERQRIKDEEARSPRPELIEEDDLPQVDPNLCTLTVRLEGKKKIYQLDFHADDDTLSTVLAKMPKLPKTDNNDKEDDIFQITCVAKKLVVSSSDNSVMNRSLRALKLYPTATLVVGNVGSKTEGKETTKKLSDRVTHKKKKKGNHTMQSVGIYGKDDNLKGELVDGGGGTLYEQDVTDDEKDDEITKQPAMTHDANEVETVEEENEDTASEQIEDELDDDDLGDIDQDDVDMFDVESGSIGKE
jgi:PUB domain